MKKVLRYISPLLKVPDFSYISLAVLYSLVLFYRSGFLCICFIHFESVFQQIQLICKLQLVMA